MALRIWLRRVNCACNVPPTKLDRSKAYAYQYNNSSSRVLVFMNPAFTDASDPKHAMFFDGRSFTYGSMDYLNRAYTYIGVTQISDLEVMF